MSDDIPFLKRHKSTGQAKIVELDSRREYIPVAYSCLDCAIKYVAYLPDVPSLSSFLTCDCGSKKIFLIKGASEEQLYDMDIEFSPDLWNWRKRKQ